MLYSMPQLKRPSIYSISASWVGSWPYQTRTWSKKSIRLTPDRTSAPAGPIKMPLAKVAMRLMIWGCSRMGDTLPSGRSSPVSSKAARYRSVQVAASAANVSNAGEASGSSKSRSRSPRASCETWAINSSRDMAVAAASTWNRKGTKGIRHLLGTAPVLFHRSLKLKFCNSARNLSAMAAGI